MSKDPYPYEAWEDVGRNQPTLSSLDEAPTLSGLTSPVPVLSRALDEDSDLTTNSGTGQVPIGQRIVVSGHVLDETGAPVPDTLIEIWQANAAGKYVHENDTVDAPVDPNFTGVGRCISDVNGVYRFVTVRPGAYPWKDDTNQWRPAHIHLSVISPANASRLVTQMYFEGDPLFDLDQIFLDIPDEQKPRAMCRFDPALTEPGFALATATTSCCVVRSAPPGMPTMMTTITLGAVSHEPAVDTGADSRTVLHPGHGSRRCQCPGQGGHRG